MRHPVGVCAGRKDACSMEVQRSTGLEKPVAVLAGRSPLIQITAQMRVLVAIEPVDGRKGIDSLVRLCQDKLAEDAIRLLTYDGQGFWLTQKCDRSLARPWIVGDHSDLPARRHAAGRTSLLAHASPSGLKPARFRPKDAPLAFLEGL